MSELLEAMYKDALNNVEQFKTVYKELVLEKQKDDNNFLLNLNNKWGECFDLYESLYCITLEACEAYIKKLEENKELQTDMFLVMRELHGRACQVYLEILCLLKNGFADGAYARWRTLYELTIIAFFIKKEGEETAKSYLDNAKIDSNNFDWAKCAQSLKDKKRIYFTDIVSQCDLSDDWDKEYKTSCKTVHANPNGTFGRISCKEGYNFIPVGRSDKGMQLAATHACINLSQITTCFLLVHPIYEAQVTAILIKMWSNFIADVFMEAEKEIFTANSVTIIE